MFLVDGSQPIHAPFLITDRVRMAKRLLAPPQGRFIALQRQDAFRRVLSPPSSIDSCVPIHLKKQNKMAPLFLSVKGIPVPNVLMLMED